MPPSEKNSFTPRRFKVTPESTVALYDIADSLLDLGADESAKIVAEAAYALYIANGEINCVQALLERPRKNKRTIRDWSEDMRKFGWGLEDGPELVLPWNATPLERAAGRSIIAESAKRAIEDVKTDVV